MLHELLTEWKAKTDAATEADAEFIAMSRTAVPGLLAAVEAIRALCDAVDASEGAYRSLIHSSSIRSILNDAIGDSDHE